MKMIACCIVWMLLLLTARGQVQPAPIFTSNMVLQQNSLVPVWGWAKGKNVQVTTSWNKQTYRASVNEAGEFRVMIKTPAAGGPYTMRISDGQSIILDNILIGEVWLCAGQSNMEMPMRGFKGQPVEGSNEAILHSSNKRIRIYTVPRSAQPTPTAKGKTSEWKEANPESVAAFSATAWYFGKELEELLQVPVGLINVSYGGSQVESWMDAAHLAALPEIKIPAARDSIKSPNRTPTALYNGMVYPVKGFGIRGFIWYQGESNYERPDQYEQLFPAMVREWREDWANDSLPFYYAQIAPYNYAQLPPYNVGGKFNSAYLRDAQRKALSSIPNSGLAVLMDVGEEANIHPAHKKEGGQRLALLALAKTYGLKGFGYESPAYDTLVVNNGIAEVRFKYAPNWLTSYGKELTQFEIAGKDRVFYPAKAVIYRSSVMVSSPQVKEPVAVRYAFRDYIRGELFSTEGLPVSSFRTDNW